MDSCSESDGSSSEVEADFWTVPEVNDVQGQPRFQWIDLIYADTTVSFDGAADEAWSSAKREIRIPGER